MGREEGGQVCGCAAGGVEEECWVGVGRRKLGERDCFLVERR